MKIATLIDPQGQTLPLQESGILRINTYRDGCWQTLHEVPFSGTSARSIPELRQEIETLARQLGDCRILVVSAIQGIARSFLDGLGVRMWRVRGTPEAALEAIRQETERARARQPPDPLDFFESVSLDGDWKIDLISALASPAGFNSRELLLPFFARREFRHLEVICDHPPRWIDKQLPMLGLGWQVEKLGDGLCRLTIEKDPHVRMNHQSLEEFANCGTCQQGSCSSGQENF